MPTNLRSHFQASLSPFFLSLSVLASWLFLSSPPLPPPLSSFHPSPPPPPPPPLSPLQIWLGGRKGGRKVLDYLLSLSFFFLSWFGPTFVKQEEEPPSASLFSFMQKESSPWAMLSSVPISLPSSYTRPDPTELKHREREKDFFIDFLPSCSSSSSSFQNLSFSLSPIPPTVMNFITLADFSSLLDPLTFIGGCAHFICF